MKKNKKQISSDRFLWQLGLLIIILIIAIILNQQLEKRFSQKVEKNKPVNIITPKFIGHSSPITDQIITSEVFNLPVNQQEFEELSFLASPDGQRFAYIVKRNGLEAVSLNGSVGAAYNKIIFLRFSPDGQRFAYGAETINGKELVVLDGQEGQLYDWILEPWFFTPDNQYFVYKARNSNGDVLVFNNWVSQSYERIFNPVIDSTASQLTFYGRNGEELWRNQVDLR